MPEEEYSELLLRVWRQKEIPIVLRRARPEPLLVKLPPAQINFMWLRDDQRRSPIWNEKYKAWETPQAWFERTDSTLFKTLFKLLCYSAA